MKRIACVILAWMAAAVIVAVGMSSAEARPTFQRAPTIGPVTTQTSLGSLLGKVLAGIKLPTRTKEGWYYCDADGDAYLQYGREYPNLQSCQQAGCTNCFLSPRANLPINDCRDTVKMPSCGKRVDGCHYSRHIAGHMSYRYCRDADGDGQGDWNNCWEYCSQQPGYSMHGSDCDDTNASVYLDAPELCDGIDNDCRPHYPAETCGPDEDGDGFYPQAVHGSIVYDCDDDDAAVHVGADERCNGRDDDCNGVMDGVAQQNDACHDVDGDNYYENAVDLAIRDCSADPAINPGAPELCDRIDNSCDNLVDNRAPPCTDADGDGYYPNADVANASDCNDGDATIYAGAPEICDNKDNNCDGSVDEGAMPGGVELPDDNIDNDCDGFVDLHDLDLWQNAVDADGDKFPESIGATVLDCNDNSSQFHPPCPDVTAYGSVVYNQHFQGCTPPTQETCTDQDPQDYDCDGHRHAYTEACALCKKEQFVGNVWQTKYKDPDHENASGVVISEVSYAGETLDPERKGRIRIRFSESDPWIDPGVNFYNTHRVSGTTCYNVYWDGYTGAYDAVNNIDCTTDTSCGGTPCHHDIWRLEDHAQLENSADVAILPDLAAYRTLIANGEYAAIEQGYLNPLFNTTNCRIDPTDSGRLRTSSCMTGVSGAPQDECATGAANWIRSSECKRLLLLKERYCENPRSTKVRTVLLNCMDVGMNNQTNNEVGVCDAGKCQAMNVFEHGMSYYQRCLNSHTGACVDVNPDFNQCCPAFPDPADRECLTSPPPPPPIPAPPTLK